MPVEEWTCETCGATNFDNMKGSLSVVCKRCGELYITSKRDEAKKGSEEYLASINNHLAKISASLSAADRFRESEQRVLNEIEAIIRRYK